MNKYKQIPENEWQVMEEKIVMTSKKENQLVYIDLLSNPTNDSVINNEYLELKLRDYYTDLYVDFIRPSDLLHQYIITDEAYIRLIMWQSKIIRELNEQVLFANHMIKRTGNKEDEALEE